MNALAQRKDPAAEQGLGTTGDCRQDGFIIPHNDGFAEAYAYLAARGITPEAAERLGIQFVSGNVAAFKLKLACTLGKTLGTDRVVRWPSAIYLPGRGSDGRIIPDYGQAIFFGGDKPVKLCTPKDVHENDATFMPLPAGVKHYSEFLPEARVFIAESYIKGGVLSGMGLPAIALNGVRGGSLHGNLVQALSEDWWTTVRYQAIVIFDSLSTNPDSTSRADVTEARRQLCAKLKGDRKDIRVAYIELPEPPQDWLDAHPGKYDWGLDDYNMHHGQSALRSLLMGPVVAPDVSHKKAMLDEMNLGFAWIRSVARIADVESGKLWNKADFFNDQLPNKVYTADSKEKMKWQSRGPVWFNDRDRRALESVSFMPGEARVANNALNLWKGFDVEPSDSPRALERADRYWASVVREAFPDGGEHLLDILAVRVQQPQRRITRYVYANGKAGTGKTYAFHPILSIYGGGGGHAFVATEESFINKFNASFVTAHFVIIPEAAEAMDRGQGKAFEARLKFESDGSQRRRPFERKGQDVDHIEKNTLPVIVSNYDPAFPIPAGDRRGLFIRSNSAMAIENPGFSLGTKPLAWWGERWAWMNSEGPSEVLAWLLARDISGVDFEGTAPSTKYKKELMREAVYGYAGFVDQLQVDPTNFLVERGMPREDAEKVICATSNQLVRLFFADNPSALPTNLKGAATTMGRAAAKVLEHEPGRFSYREGSRVISGRAFCLRAGHELLSGLKDDSLSQTGETSKLHAACAPLENWLSTLDFVVGMGSKY